MTQVSSVDYNNKRIYLHEDTRVSGFNIIDAYFEINQLVQANVNNEQNYPAMLSAEGNIPKGGGKFTPRYGYLAAEWRIVPYDGLSHSLALTVEPVSADGLSGADVFDRLGLVVKVDIDVAYDQVEIIKVNTGSAVEPSDVTDIANAVWNYTISALTDTSTIGGFLARKLLTVARFLSLK